VSVTGCTTERAVGARARTAACGFSLLEVLIAIGILSLAVGGVLAVFAAAVRSHSRAVHSTEAAMIASSVVSEARARFKPDVTLPPVKDAHFPGKPRYRFDIEYVELDKPGDEVMMIVRVHWKERGRLTSYLFTTILVRKPE
jgi:prepilin-type N-terminal cleavage/methylation domain-containing protein